MKSLGKKFSIIIMAWIQIVLFILQPIVTSYADSQPALSHSYSSIRLHHSEPPLESESSVALPRSLSLQASETETSEQTNAAHFHPLTSELLQAVHHPFVDAVENATNIPDVDLDFAANDPVVDQDPFFLKSQKWTQTFEFINFENQKFSFEFRNQNQNLEIQISYNSANDNFNATNANLTIQTKLKPVLQTQDYIILSADSKQFFNEKTIDEGIFILSKEELIDSSKSGASVPIFFFPLPEGSWSEGLRAVDLNTSHALLLMSQDGSLLPIFYADIAKVIFAERQNLFIATAFGLKEKIRSKGEANSISEKKVGELFGQFVNTFNPNSQKQDIQASQSQLQALSSGLQKEFGIFPQEGATAGFGTVLVHKTAKTARHTSFFNFVSDLAQNIFWIPNANAQEASDLSAEQKALLAAQNEQLISRITRVVAILSVGLIASVTLRYTLYKKHFDKRRSELNQKPSTWMARSTLNIKEIFDVNAHLLTVLFQVPNVTLGRVTEFTLDRIFPAATAGENKWVRKILEKTIFRAGHASSHVPVNANTWFKGAIILGGIDTACVGIQLYHVVPWMSRMIADWLPFLKPRVDSAFEVGNPLIDNLNRNEVVRNVFAYLSAGAVTFSSEVRQQVIFIVGPEVDKKLLQEGYDLNSPRTQSIRQRRLEAASQIYMRKIGLPGPDEFLFDYVTLYDQAYRLLGYQMDPGKADTEENAKDAEKLHLMGEQRPGLVLSSLSKAIKNLKNEINNHPESEENLKAALQILISTQKDASYLRGLLARSLKNWLKPSAFREALSAFRKARQSLLSLTFEGEVGEEVKLLPTQWVSQFGQEGAAQAAKFYRNAFMDYLHGGAASHTEVTENSEADKASQNNETTLESSSSNDSSSPHYSWMESIQKRKAAQKADTIYAASEGRPFEPLSATETQIVKWREAYVESLMNILGLYPDYDFQPELKEQVKTKSADISAKAIEDVGFKNTLKTLDLRSQAIMIGDIYAQNEISEYLAHTVRDDQVSGLSPAQPGRFQKIRQTKFLRKDTLVARMSTRFLRGIESVFAEAEYTPGLTTMIYRNVPGAFDMWKSFVRGLSMTPSRVSAAFLYNWLFWGADISWNMWLYFSVFTWFTIAGPAQMATRFFTFQNWKPLGSLWLMAALGLFHTWMTFWGTIPSYIFAADFQSSALKILASGAATLLTLKGASVLIDKFTSQSVSGEKRLNTSFSQRCMNLFAGGLKFSRGRAR